MNGPWQFTLAIALALSGPHDVFAQRLVCYTIHRGDTAGQAAKRLTGDAGNKDQPWFQIVDPAASRFISKARYNRIRPGWRACIVRQPVMKGAKSVVRAPEAVARPPEPDYQLQAREINERPVQQLQASGANERSVMAGAVRLLRSIDLSVLGLAALVWVMWFVWRVVEDYIRHRQTTLIVMMLFGERFVREFERPLIQEQTDHPLRSQFRFSPSRARLEILLAPGTGRRYPNLSDHRKNVEYDVARVVQSLADKSFVGESPYAQQDWVVVPFQLRVDRKG